MERTPPNQPRFSGPGTLVLVTHALTVGPLTGFLPEQAETVVLQPTPGNPRGKSCGQDRATPIGTDNLALERTRNLPR